MALLYFLKEDFLANKGNIRIQLLLIAYRIAHVASILRKKSAFYWFWAVPYLIVYRFLTEWVLHMEIPAATVIGEGLIIDHGYSIVINKNTVIGKYCRLRHLVTIGCKLNEDGSQGRSPEIGDYVDIGASAVLIGGINIGDYTKIGAGAVVTKDIPKNAVVVGNPSRIII